MASIREKKQGNKVVSYQFICCLGRDARGKQIRRYSTWTPPDDLTPSNAKKAPERGVEVWEQTIREVFEQDLNDPERAKIKDIVHLNSDFSSFACNI